MWQDTAMWLDMACIHLTFCISGSGLLSMHACRYKPFSQLTCIGVGKSGHCSYMPWWQNQQFYHCSHRQHRHEWLQREPVSRSDLYVASHRSNLQRKEQDWSVNEHWPAFLHGVLEQFFWEQHQCAPVSSGYPGNSKTQSSSSYHKLAPPIVKQFWSVHAYPYLYFSVPV